MQPGRLIEHDETVDAAVQREVLAETTVEAEIEGLIAVLNRGFGDFLLRAQDEDTQADGLKVDEAVFTLQELENSPR